MTRLEALTELLVKVGADDIDALPDNCFRHAFAGMPTAGIGFNFSEAHEGSLDAAKALHEAVLPSSWFELQRWPVPNMCLARVGDFEGRADNPARAWLLAILRALEALEADA